MVYLAFLTSRCSRLLFHSVRKIWQLSFWYFLFLFPSFTFIWTTSVLYLCNFYLLIFDSAPAVESWKDALRVDRTMQLQLCIQTL